MTAFDRAFALLKDDDLIEKFTDFLGTLKYRCRLSLIITPNY